MAFKNIYKVTNIIKLRDFQFRLLHNKILCNNVLFCYQIKDSQQRDWCETSKQNIEHLLYTCNVTSLFWSKIRNYLNTGTKDPEVMSNLVWSWENILYNLVHPKCTHIINFIVLMAKQYIYRCKCMNKKLNMLEFSQEINFIKEIEFYNAQTLKQQIFNKCKWNRLDLR